MHFFMVSLFVFCLSVCSSVMLCIDRPCEVLFQNFVKGYMYDALPIS